MIVSPYQTMACKAYAHTLPAIDKAIKLALIEDGMTPARMGGKTLGGVVVVRPENKEVPPFAHPYIYQADRIEDSFVLIDARGFIRPDRDAPGGYKVTQNTEFDFLAVRAALTRYAHLHGGEDLQNAGDIAMVAFARFLSENIVRRLGLSPEEQALLTMVTAFYYLCLFRSESELDESDINKMVTKVSRATYLPAQWIFERMDKLAYMGNITDYVRVVKEVIENRRMDNFSPALLFGIVGGGWFGSNSKEVMAVALEHPPTFLAMVYTALRDRSYRNAGVAKSVLANDKRDAGRQFLQNLVQLVEVGNV